MKHSELVRRKIDGTPFSLVAPAGFRQATRFDGLIGPDESTSLMITALPVPLDKISEMWQPDKLRAQGMSLVKKEPVSVSGVTAELALVDHRASGTEFEKLILVFPTAMQTYLCVAAYPSKQREALRSPMRDALLSLTYDATALATARTFQIEVTDLKLAHTFSKTEMYTLDGKAQQSSPGAPLFLVGPSVAKVAPNDRRGYAEQRLRKIQHTTIVDAALPTPLVVDSLPGFESVATATDTSSGLPMTAYQVMLFADDHYILIQGLVGRDQASTYLPQFQKAARSFRRTSRAR